MCILSVNSPLRRVNLYRSFPRVAADIMAIALIAPFEFDPDVVGLLYLAGKRLWKYSDAGFRFPIKDSLSNGTTITAIAAENNGQIIYVGYKNGIVEKTTDAGFVPTSLEETFYI